MTDESKLQQDAVRGSRAKSLLENELLIEAFDALEKAYIASWRTTNADATADREKLFLAVNIIGKVRDHIGMIASNGNLAQKELNRMAEEVQRATERKKRYGLV
jgi:hypothetical protein